jgi:1-deoxy-D-xylulose-5-phosphate synthase
MATARDISGEDFNVVAVIGDGSLTGGMSFEGLNQAGHLRSKLIVVLNDNAMAISPSVGALSRSLSEIRLNPKYYKTKEGASRTVRRMPAGEIL